MRIPTLAVALAFTLMGPRPALAQDAIELRPLVGRILDAQTRSPLLGAWISPAEADWGTYSRDDGTFHLPDVYAGAALYRVEMLGYQTVLIEASPDAPLELLLEPDPIVLEGIRIVTDRFSRRRNATPYSVRAIDRADLLWAGASDMLDFIRGRAGVHVFPCPSNMAFAVDCVMRRGQPQPITVCLDEMPFYGGSDALRSVQPHELEMVEVYRWGAHIRLYTTDFMQNAGRRRLNVPPLGLGAC